VLLIRAFVGYWVGAWRFAPLPFALYAVLPLQSVFVPPPGHGKLL
jgi:hypothetical protein